MSYNLLLKPDLADSRHIITNEDQPPAWLAKAISKTRKTKIRKNIKNNFSVSIDLNPQETSHNISKIKYTNWMDPRTEKKPTMVRYNPKTKRLDQAYRYTVKNYSLRPGEAILELDPFMGKKQYRTKARQKAYTMHIINWAESEVQKAKQNKTKLN